MSRMIEKLEEAREALEDSPAQALKLLPSAASLPTLFRPERDFIAAEAWRQRGYFERAEKLYSKIVRSKKLDPDLHTEACLGSAAGHRSLGHIKLAQARLQEAQRTLQRHGLRSYREPLRLEKALVLRAQGHYRAALTPLRALLKKAVQDRDWARAGFLLWAIGGAERFQGDLQASESSFRKSLSYAQRAEDAVGAGYAHFGLGGITRVRGKFSEAAKHYAKAEKIFRGSDDDFARAYALCGYANALRQLGRLAEAEKYYLRSYKVYSSLEDKVDLAYVDWGLGEVHLRRGEVRKAVARFKAALRAFLAGGEDRGSVLSMVSLSRALHVVGKTAEAEALFSKGITLARRVGLHAHLEIYT
jgi:tetratricopeptide (TPR) repeat protein